MHTRAAECWRLLEAESLFLITRGVAERGIDKKGKEKNKIRRKEGLSTIPVQRAAHSAS
jgi:hypothetical protein